MYELELDPRSSCHIFMKAYKNVKNIKEIKRKLFSGDLKCCVCKSSLILDPFQIVVAANKAIVAEKLTTKTIYTEVLFNLSISKNITQSLQKFGIDDSVTDIVVAVIAKKDDTIAQEIFLEIDGEEFDLSLLPTLVNKKEIKKTYKVSDIELKNLPLLDSVVTRIAVSDLL